MTDTRSDISNQRAFNAEDPAAEAIEPRMAEQDLEETAAEVYDLIGVPIDTWAVAAAMESLGLRDLDAVETYKKANVFELAELVHQRILALPRTPRPEHHPGHEQTKKKKGKLARLVSSYGKGAVTAMPMVGQIACIFIFRYSLWAWVDFTEAQATIVALGTLLSFIVTGGFIQSIGREGIRLVGSENYFLAEKTCWTLVAQGTYKVIAVAIVIFLVALVFPLFDIRLTLVSLMYFILLAELWLYASVAVVLSRPMAVLAITLAGVLPVYLVMHWTTLGIYVAHWCGMSFALLLMMMYTMIVFRSAAEGTIPELKSGRLPKPSVRVYLIAPYFVYGFFYFLNIFSDRLVSWSTASPEPPPFMIWFRTSYELGMDWALISLVFTLALLEFVINEFSYFQIPAQKAVKCLRVSDYISFFKRFYKKFLVVLIIVAAVDIIATYYGVGYFKRYNEVKEIREFFSSPTTYFVFFAASIGYLFIAVGLYNSLFFFTLSRPGFVLQSIIPATAVNLIVALLASRWIQYQYGVLGLVAGGITFMVLSTRKAREFFHGLDYYYYAAY